MIVNMHDLLDTVAAALRADKNGTLRQAATLHDETR